MNTSKEDDGKVNEKSPKITLKIVRSPHRGHKRKNKKFEELGEGKLIKKVRKELFDEDYAPSDSGSNGEKSSEASIFKYKKMQLFRGAKVERVCQICLQIMEGEKIMKCKGACQGLFHVSCANKMTGESQTTNDDTTPKAKGGKRRKPKKSESSEAPIQEWRCNDCIRGENPCFVCKSRSGNRQKCRICKYK